MEESKERRIMKLITETIEDIQYITEGPEDKKSLFIEGVFMVSDECNRNGRVYPYDTLNKEVGRYITEFVNCNRAFGELGHPTGPTVNLDRVSHRIVMLEFKKNKVYGKAKILESTPMGKIAGELIREGAKLGVSSRAMGSLVEQNGKKIVQPDLMLSAVDIVADPSAPGAFVNGIMEGKEWVWNNGSWLERDLMEAKRTMKKTSTKNIEKKALRLFEDFFKKL
jgi:hypothetical protein